MVGKQIRLQRGSHRRARRWGRWARRASSFLEMGERNAPWIRQADRDLVEMGSAAVKAGSGDMRMGSAALQVGPVVVRIAGAGPQVSSEANEVGSEGNALRRVCQNLARGH
jgi:hypothetical protein